MFYGWWIVIALVLIGGYFNGVVMGSFTAIIQPIAAEFGWSYTQISLAASMRSVETGILSPVIGLMIKRFGARKLIFAGILVSSLGLFLLSITSSLAMFFGAYIIGNIGININSLRTSGTNINNKGNRKTSVSSINSTLNCGSLEGFKVNPER